MESGCKPIPARRIWVIDCVVTPNNALCKVAALHSDQKKLDVCFTLSWQTVIGARTAKVRLVQLPH